MLNSFARQYKKTKGGFGEWYQENRRRQVRYWGVVGGFIGTIWGISHRQLRLARVDFGDHILITEYSIDKNNVRDFERCWNDHAKLTQRFEGYIGTKLFKVLNRDWTDNNEAIETNRNTESSEKTIQENQVIFHQDVNQQHEVR